MTCLSRPLALCALVLAAPASADVIYNNFGEGDTYTVDSGWTISAGVPINTDWDQGDPFTVEGGDYVLTSIEFAMGFVTGTNQIELTLHADADGLPGEVLEAWTLSNFGPFGSNNPPREAVSVVQPTLEEGATYWVIASSANNAWLAWNWNSTGDIGTHAQRRDMGSWALVNNFRGVYRVNADAVALCPEDLDDDDFVGFSDVLVLLTEWGPYTPCPPFKPADLDQSCDVGFSDLLLLLSAWGPCPSAAHPAPIETESVVEPVLDDVDPSSITQIGDLER